MVDLHCNDKTEENRDDETQKEAEGKQEEQREEQSLPKENVHLTAQKIMKVMQAKGTNNRNSKLDAVV